MRRAARCCASVLLAAVLLAAGCGSDGEPAPGSGTGSPPAGAQPTGRPLTGADIQQLAAQFPDNPLTGGQTAPRSYRWVNDRVAIFLQFDDRDAGKATKLQYVGVSVKGVFCAESQPGGAQGGFTHFHRLDAPEYGQGHGGPPGTPGYWLSWTAVDEFTARDGRQITPGVDYQFSPTPAPACGGNVPAADFAAPGARTLTPADISALGALFPDNPLTGGQVAPRLYRWVNETVAVFAQFDNRDLAKATALPYIGISVAGEFCRSTQPSADFPHFHRTEAAEYAEGHGQSPNDKGYWLLWLATDEFDARDGRHVIPGVDRQFSPTPPPDC